MKETGVIRRRVSGPEAAPYMNVARNLLGMVKQQIQFGGLSQLSRTVDLPNGVRITVMSIFGQDEVRISVPVPVPMPVPVYRKDTIKGKITYKLWLVSHIDSYIYGIYRIDPSSGNYMGESFEAKNVWSPLGVHSGNIWCAELFISNYYDEIRAIKYRTGEKKTLASRILPYPEGFHSFTMTLTEQGMLFLVGRVDPSLYLISDSGELIYEKKVSDAGRNGVSNWVGDKNLNAVNNGKKAYFFHNDISLSLQGVVEVDIATGVNINHNHSGNPSPELGYSMKNTCCIVGKDGNLYGIAHRNLDASPYDTHEIIKIDTKNYSIATLGDLSETFYDVDGYQWSVVRQIHASVSESGLAFIGNEFHYAVIDTTTGAIVSSGSTESLFRFTRTTETSGYYFINEYIAANGTILPDYDSSIVNLGITRGGVMHLMRLNLKTMKFDEFSTNTPYSSVEVIPKVPGLNHYFTVEYIGEDEEKTPAYYQSRNIIYADQLF